MLEAKFIDEGDHFKVNIVMGKPGVASKKQNHIIFILHSQFTQQHNYKEPYKKPIGELSWHVIVLPPNDLYARNET